MKTGIKKSVVSMALWLTLALTMGVSLSACSSEKAGKESGHVVLAVDRVDEAAALARKNAPEAEKMDFPETVPMPAVDTAADATMSTQEGAVSVYGTAADATASADTATATAAMPATDTAAMPATDTAATDTEPATN